MTIRTFTPTDKAVFTSGTTGFGGYLGSGLYWDNEEYGQGKLEDFWANAKGDQYGSELSSSPFPLKALVLYGCSDSGLMGGSAWITRAAFKIPITYTGYESDVLRWAKLKVSVKAYDSSKYLNALLLGRLSSGFDFESSGAYGRMSSGGMGFAAIEEFSEYDFVVHEKDITELVTLGQTFVLCLTGVEIATIPSKPEELGIENGGGTYVYVGSVSIQVYTNKSELEVNCLPVTNLSTDSATLRGQLVSSGNKNFIRCRLEWGLGNYNNKGSWRYITEGNEFSLAIGGLEPDTTYQYRAVATDEVSTVYSNCSFTTLDDDPETEVITVRIELMRESWVLALIRAIPAGKELYCGVEWWELTDEEEENKSINWYNPPDGATVVRHTSDLRINIGGLLPGRTYYWRAYGEDADTEEIYYGITKSFTIPGDPIPPDIYNRGSGNNYLTPQRALQEVTRLSDGRIFTDNETVVYKSRQDRIL